MVAVIDHQIGRRVIIRARTAAGLLHCLVHDDARAALRQADRGGKAGQPGTDDVDGAQHQINA